MQSKQWRSRIPGQKLSVSIPIHLSGSCLAGVFKPACIQYRLTHNTFLSQSNVTHLSGVAGKLCHNNADWLMALQEWAQSQTLHYCFRTLHSRLANELRTSMTVDSGNNLVTGEIFNNTYNLFICFVQKEKKNLCAIENVSKLINIHDFLPSVTASSSKDLELKITSQIMTNCVKLNQCKWSNYLTEFAIWLDT